MEQRRIQIRIFTDGKGVIEGQPGGLLWNFDTSVPGESVMCRLEDREAHGPDMKIDSCP